MKYQDRKTKIVIVMITVSLAGLMTVQLLLLGIAWELKDQAFQRNVLTALTVSSQRLEVGEITSNALDAMYQIEISDSLHFPEPLAKFHSSDLGQLPGKISLNQSGSFPETHQLTLIMANGRTQLIQQIVGDLVVQKPRPIQERLRQANIDSLLRTNLAAVGIDLLPQFYVYAAGGDSVVMTSANGNTGLAVDQLAEAKFRSLLFPLDFNSEIYELVLHFPNQRRFLLEEIWPLLAASIVFIAVLIVAFVVTIGSANQQRRFATRIVDFINNMTHEFKTPLSTVALASEAIGREDILQQPAALQRYNRMIGDENRRMGQQVERILQIAQLETGDFQLNLTPVDMHDLARTSADKFALQIEKRGGTLSLDLAAERNTVLGDPMHLTNVLANLLDNAIKYSPQAPVIGLVSYNQDHRLVLEVRDQGLGIKQADRERVFEKYYRCPTGDRHDVKGFGLGLSYVRLLVEDHGGEVKLAGPSSQGTCVVLKLPLDKAARQPGSVE